MSFLEEEIGNYLDEETVNTVDREIYSFRNSKKLSKDDIVSEFKELRKIISSNINSLEKALKRIDTLEESISSLEIEKSKQKKSLRNDSIGNKEIIDIILIKKDADVPPDHENVLLITDEKMGISVYIPTDELLHICNEILTTSVGTKISTNKCIKTGKYSVLNENNEWILMESSETTSASTTILD